MDECRLYGCDQLFSCTKLLLEDVSLQSCDLNFIFTIKFVKFVRLLEALLDICRDACRELNGRENMKHAFSFSIWLSYRKLKATQCRVSDALHE